jgi:D-threonate/D-erythronate kinase
MRKIAVIADDLTGACEIAGMAFVRGLDACVELRSDGTSPVEPGAAHRCDVRVIDTETRLADPRHASAMIERVVRSSVTPASLFKKTDSVLRGPVYAELESLARALGHSRVVLVPSNPGLERAVTKGTYRIRGIPLHETAFARDPQHPAKSSDVRELLHGAGKLPVHSVTRDGDIPSDGILVGDAATWEDLDAWARRCAEADMLAAGSSAFFSRWLGYVSPTTLTGLQNTASETVELGRRVLVISGTTVETQKNLTRAAANVLPLNPLRDLRSSDFTARVCEVLEMRGRAVTFVDAPLLTSSRAIADELGETFASTAAAALRQELVDHLIIEGGTTAAGVATKLGWTELTVVHQWSPGVVSLRPASAPQHMITVKPGSYPWPDRIAAAFFRAPVASHL